MGEVYRARDTRLQREVALKILPDSFAADKDRLARFEREAQTLASLNHPHIAGLYGLEESTPATGTAVRALVMELVDGEDLSARIARGALPLDEALPLALQIAEALEAAHEAGIVHRDLKPANIKVKADGAIKVLDFGLAKAIEGGSRDSVLNSPTITSPLTMGGVILGTAAYMPPEQAKGRAVDRRADIWAFGCVLYEMLTGRQAFEGDDVTEILGAIVKTDADWTRLPPSTPASIRTLLRRCLTKDPKRRLQHIGDARIEITDAPSSDQVMPPVAHPGKSRLAWGIAAVLGVVAVAAIAVALRPRPGPMETRLEVTTPRTAGQSGSFAISPDGRAIVFTGEKDNTNVLWLRTMDAASARPLPGTENAALPFWSPDSRSIGFGASGQLKRIDAAGGLPQVVAAAAVFRGGAWNNKGDIVFAPGNASSLFRVSAAGGEARPLTALNGAGSHRWPVFLPDDDHFLYIEQSTAGSALFVASLTTPTGTRLLESDIPPAFASPGLVFFGSQGALYAQRFDTRSASLVGERFVAIRQETVAVGGVAAAIDAGTFVYRLLGTSGLTRLSWRDRAGKRLEPFFDVGGVEPELSPDGKRAAVVRSVAVASDSNDLWIIDLTRALPTRFTSDPGSEIWPTWSPDSSQVAYGKAGQIYLRSLTGAQSTLLENPQLQKVPADWSRDGTSLLYRTIGAGSLGDVWALPMTGDRKPFAVIETPFDEARPQFSPDAQWVSYESTESKRNEIYVRRFNKPGATIQISVGGGSEARWHPNGREIFYVGTGARMMSVAVRPSVDGSSLEVSPPRELFATQIFRGGSAAANVKFQYAVSGDGERFLINEQVTEDVASPLVVVLNWKPPSK
jgi:Tol biopolymer transport system component